MAIVLMVGAGTAQDPRRPLFAPIPGERTAKSGFTYQISDDGRSALVQFVARSRADFQSLLPAARADVKGSLCGRVDSQWTNSDAMRCEGIRIRW